MKTKRTRAAAAVALCVAAASGARGKEPAGVDDAALEAIVSAAASSATAVDRSWLYNDPTRIAAPGRAIGLMRVTYGGGSPTRPFAGNLSTSGAMVEIGGEVGLVDHLSLVAIGSQGDDGGGSGQTGGMLGLRWSLLPATLKTHLVLSGGVLRELQGSAGAWARASLGHDAGRLRLAASVHAERLFASGRDAIDVIATAGATIRLLETVRAGIEYVGQDLEGAFEEEEAEGGARHVVGPTISVALFGQRLSATAGPALALGAGQTHVLGKAALTYQF